MTAAAVGIALLVPAGMGIATADPDLNWAVSTKCDYSQVVAAMKVQSPAAAAQLDATPAEQSFLQTFLTAPPAQRQQMLEQAESSPEGAQLISAFQPIANTCTNY
ncbi:MAG: hemophore-related protein [Mycobacterium sp.]